MIVTPVSVFSNIVNNSLAGKPDDSAMEKRAERFGKATAADETTAAGETATTVKTPPSTPEMDELKKKRAERFKITAP